MSSLKILGALGIVLALSAAASSGPIYFDDLIAYYSFDNASNLGEDSSVNGYDGTVVNNVAAASGYYGGAANIGQRTSNGLGGYNYNYIELPAADILTGGDIPTSNFTVAAWCRIQSKVAGGDADHHTIFGAKASDDTYLVHAELRPNDSTPDYRFTLRGYGGNTIGTITPDSSNIYDVWHHVAMTYDRSANTMIIYIDGSPISTKTDCADLDIAGDWSQGARLGANTDPNRQFYGLMDELYLFKRTLSQDEIGVLASVPEPSAIALAVCAVLSSLIFRRKWKR